MRTPHWTAEGGRPKLTIHEQQHARYHPKEREQEAAVRNTHAEYRQQVAQDHPHPQQQHAFRAVHSYEHRRLAIPVTCLPRYGADTVSSLRTVARAGPRPRYGHRITDA